MPTKIQTRNGKKVKITYNERGRILRIDEMKARKTKTGKSLEKRRRRIKK
jgi:YD repeat-containing protein